MIINIFVVILLNTSTIVDSGIKILYLHSRGIFHCKSLLIYTFYLKIYVMLILNVYL